MNLRANLILKHKKYTEVDADLFIRTNGTCEEVPLEECQFAKYGFEKPYFECVILGEVDNMFIGYVRMHNKKVYPPHWYKNGCRELGEGNIWNLTPIKKPWYETCKFPCLVKDRDDTFTISTTEGYSERYLATLTPLTNHEIEELKQ